MRILFVWKECPFPPDRSGSRRRAAALLGSLERGQIGTELIYFSDPGDSGGIPRRTGIRRRIQEMIAPGIPLFRPYYESGEMRRAIERAARRADAVILGQDQMAVYRDAVGDTPCTLDATDAWPVVIDSLIRTERAAWRRSYLRRHRRRIEAHIREYYHRFDSVLVVSERDERALRDVDPRIRARTFPHCIDPDGFGPGREAEAPTAIFAGVMSHAPNADGAVRLVREIWPRVRRAVPGARLRIVGRAPREEVRGLACEDVEVTGAVPSIAAELASSWVALCPMWSGAGMKTKVLEAMAAGKPIVSTPEGVEGMPYAEAAGVRVSDDPIRFGDETVALFRSREARRRAGERLRAYVEERFSSARAEKELRSLLTGPAAVTG